MYVLFPFPRCFLAERTAALGVGIKALLIAFSTKESTTIHAFDRFIDELVANRTAEEVFVEGG